MATAINQTNPPPKPPKSKEKPAPPVLRHGTLIVAALGLFGFSSFVGCDDGQPLSTGTFQNSATVTQPIVNGTREPEVVPLSDGQLLALGYLHSPNQPTSPFCTGTIIAPDVVATARHCTEGSSASALGFGIGVDPSNYLAVFRVVQLFEHPSADAALLVLEEGSTAGIEGLVPIAHNQESIGEDDIGRELQAGGYGQTYDRSRDGRWFARVYLDQVWGDSIQVDGRGDQGICYGDSGGPVIWLNDDDEPVVLAVESYGDSSCVDQDVLTRLDTISDWIEPVLNGESPNDPCNGLDFLGRCDGDVAEWCSEGEIRQRDCGSWGTTCGWISNQVGYACTCGDLDYTGRCDSNVAEYCDDGNFRRVNCEARGQYCGWLGGDLGYFCTDEPSCSDEDRAGRCEDGNLIRCGDNDQWQTDFCSANGLTCGELTDGTLGCVGDTGDTPMADVGTLDVGVNGDDATISNGGNSGNSAEDGCQQVRGPTGLPALLFLGLLGTLIRRR